MTPAQLGILAGVTWILAATAFIWLWSRMMPQRSDEEQRLEDEEQMAALRQQLERAPPQRHEGSA